MSDKNDTWPAELREALESIDQFRQHLNGLALFGGQENSRQMALQAEAMKKAVEKHKTRLALDEVVDRLRPAPPQALQLSSRLRRFRRRRVRLIQMKNLQTIEQRVKDIIVNQTNIPESYIVPEASFLDDLGCDSLDMVEICMALEDEFREEIGLEMPIDLTNLQTFGQVVEYIKSKQP